MKISLTKRSLVVGSAITSMLFAAPTVANAASSNGPGPKLERVSPATALAAWECPVGDVCVWTDRDGQGSRCAWSDADPDWLAGSIICSWSGALPVHSFWNRGTSTRFFGVAFYSSPNYKNPLGCGSPQGTAWNISSSSGAYLRSHQWITTSLCG
jgi:hypothetical protein